ncbi:MAG: tetratricopeptide repeat protein [Sphingomonas pseudosanguinis]|uniref:tetratricopeptide repeat protein n=1 Tax=Sphingomonas pseudosanguinis TaxID=413712 RepID=UPI00391C4FCB
MMIALLLSAATLVQGPAPIPASVQTSVDSATFRSQSPTDATVTIHADTSDQTIAIRSIDDALAVMADRRLAAIWLQVLTWAGPSLEGLRDALVTDARNVFAKGRTKEAESAIASVVRPRLRPTFQLADALLASGQVEQAVQLMQSARAAEPKDSPWWSIHWAAMSQWLAKARDVHGDTQGALDILEASIPPLGNDQVKLNLEASRASVLLDLHRAAHALAAIDAVEASFEAPGGIFSRDARIKGSERQFAWIRACALQQLGRTAEAKAAAAPLYPVAEPQDRRFKIDPTVKLRKQLGLCARDVTLTAQSYAEMLRDDPYGGEALVELQPAFQRRGADPRFMDDVRRDPSLAPIIAERMRILPDELVPALNGWGAMTPAP